MIDHTSLGVRDYDRAGRLLHGSRSPRWATRCSVSGARRGRLRHGAGLGLLPLSRHAPDKSIIGERNHVAFQRAEPRRRRRLQPHRHRSRAANRSAPSVRAPDISPEYFGTVLTDPDGHTLEAVFWDRA